MVRAGASAPRNEDRMRMALAVASLMITIVVLATLFLWWAGWAIPNDWTLL
jgi:hypothetical protein